MAEAKKKAPRVRKTRSKRSLAVSLQASGFTATVLALIVTGVVVLSPSLQVLAEQRQEITRLEAELQQTDAEVVRLEDQLERWSDRVFVETQARSRLMFVYPGDITYLVLDDLPEDDFDDAVEITEEVQVTKTDWRKALLASYLVAATTDAGTARDTAPPRDSQLLPSPIESPREETGQ